MEKHAHSLLKYIYNTVTYPVRQNWECDRFRKHKSFQKTQWDSNTETTETMYNQRGSHSMCILCMNSDMVKLVKVKIRRNDTQKFKCKNSSFFFLGPFQLLKTYI